MRIAEIYASIQGEGRLTGTPSVFVRTSGCNLRCWYCDTPFTSWEPEGDDLAVDEILERVLPLAQNSTGTGHRGPAGARPHVVLTGGEPMLHAELAPLAARLSDAGWHITIETAGTLWLDVRCDLMSISPKRANSTPPEARDPRWRRRHERSRHVPDVLRRLAAAYDYQFKFVIDQPADCDDVEQFLAELPGLDRSRLYLMPQGMTPEELAARSQWLEPYCREHRLAYCPRMHIEWFGFTRGT